MQDTLLPLNQALETQQDVAVPSSKKAIDVQRLHSSCISPHIVQNHQSPVGRRGFNYVMSGGDSDILRQTRKSVVYA